MILHSSPASSAEETATEIQPTAEYFNAPHVLWKQGVIIDFRSIHKAMRKGGDSDVENAFCCLQWI